MRPAPKSSVTYGLLESLGLAIVTGEYVRQGFPTEAELSEKYRASRSVTREAVKMLTAKGLLSARPRHGTIVQPESAWNLLDPDVLRWMLERKFSLQLLTSFTEMRLGIEPAAAGLAALNGTPEAIEKIGAALDRMVGAANGEHDPLLADIEFHGSILEATGNPFYAQLFELVNTALRFSIHFTNMIKGHTASIPAHQAVYDAIAARDPVSATAAMQAILLEVLNLIRTYEALAAQQDTQQHRQLSAG